VQKPHSITIRRPDDWHVHLRDGEMLKAVVNATAKQFARAIVMPNLTPPVTTTKRAAAYRDRILEAVDNDLNFTPLMTAYLTDDTDGADLKAGHADGVLTAVKLYPANATTNSSHGVTDLKATYKALEAMQDCGMPLLLHGEVTHSDVDIFDREAVFIEKHRLALRKAATSGSPKFFLGTDTAPHEQGAKESACGCAGVYNAPVAMESYVMTFDEENALDKLEGFASEFGPRFYGLPLNDGTVTLSRQDTKVADSLDAANSCVIPFHAGETLPWTFKRD